MTKALIVDDGQQNLYMLRVVLTSAGYEVEEATNGAEALELGHQSRMALT